MTIIYMEALHDRKVQSFVSHIKRNANASYHAYPDFKPSTPPKLRDNFDDMMKIAPKKKNEEALKYPETNERRRANAKQNRS